MYEYIYICTIYLFLYIYINMYIHVYIYKCINNHLHMYIHLKMISPTACDLPRLQEQLAKFGRSALPHLLERVADVDPRVAASAVRCLKQHTLTEMLKEVMLGMVKALFF